MEDFLVSCVERYKELTGVTALKRVATPFIHEPTEPEFPGLTEKVANATSLLDGSVSLPGGDLGKTKGKAETKTVEPYAAKILMKILYAARMARFDLLRAICGLAQFITKWDDECDRKLYRLVCYINSTLDMRMTGWVGDECEQWIPHVFADADFAGCSKTSRSTSGLFSCMLGPNTFFPLTGQSKRQGCVSHSTPEAEVVAADHAMRTVGVPALDLWETVLEREVVLEFHEDNETTILAMRNGYSPALRHIKRTHGVCLRWLCERFSGKGFKLYYERSARQAADIFTKSFTIPDDWLRNLRLIGHLFPERFWNTAPVKVDGKLPAGSYWISNPWADAGDQTAQPAGECVQSCAAAIGNVKGKGPSADGGHSPKADWSNDDDDDYGDYAWSVASDDEWEQEESRQSPPIATVVAEGWLIPPQAAEAPQSVTLVESLSHSSVHSTSLITPGAVTRWEWGRGRWRLRIRRLPTAAMAPALALLPPPLRRGLHQGCGLHPGGGERRHTVSRERASRRSPRERGSNNCPGPPTG
jgi:hypothetical protein